MTFSWKSISDFSKYSSDEKYRTAGFVASHRYEKTHTQQETDSTMSITTREKSPSKMTNAEKMERIRSALEELATETPEGTQLIARHIDPANQISAPVDMPESVVLMKAQEAATAAGQVVTMTKTFHCRPGDGALAMNDIFLQLFGTVGAPKPIMSFFGPITPEQIEVVVGLDEKGNEITRHAQWGRIEFSPIEGELWLGETEHKELGSLFQITAKVKLGRKKAVSGLFEALRQYIAANSIYKGKSIRGTKEPKFVSLKRDPGIVYTRAVEGALDLSLWGVIESPDALKYGNMRINPQVLLYGTFGTGKSEAGRETAEIANKNGWTFIQFDSATSNLTDLDNTLKTAKLLAPAVVMVEDIDTFAAKDGALDAETKQRQMLEMLDGLSSKNSNVIVLMTTNRPEALPQGVQRAGRITSMIEIGYLDQEAVIRLLRQVCGDQLGEIDEHEIFEIFKDYPPAFIRQAVDGARQSAVLARARHLKSIGQYSAAKANAGVKLNTEDFRAASAVNAKQWESYRRAGSSRNNAPTMETILTGLINQAVTKILSEGVEFTNPRIGKVEVEAVVAV